jgi:hypothetical protein
MWDDFGDGWNGGFIDVQVNDEFVVLGATLEEGYGPENVYFEASTEDTITVYWTEGGWPEESSYCIYDGDGTELGCAGIRGAEPVSLTVSGSCGP